MFLGTSMFDLAGLGLIAPYISLVINPSRTINPKFDQLFNLFNQDSTKELILVYVGLGLILIFFCKAVGNLWIHYKITSFCFRQEVRLRTNLMRNFQRMPYKLYLSRNSSEYVHSIQILVGIFGSVLHMFLKTISDVLIAFVIILVLAWQNIWILCFLLILFGGFITIYDKIFQK